MAKSIINLRNNLLETQFKDIDEIIEYLNEELLKSELLINWLKDYLEPKKDNSSMVRTADIKKCRICKKFETEKGYKEHFKEHLKDTKNYIEDLQRMLILAYAQKEHDEV